MTAEEEADTTIDAEAEATEADAEAEVTAEEETAEAPTASVLLVALPDSGRAMVGYARPAAASTEAAVELVVFRAEAS